MEAGFKPFIFFLSLQTRSKHNYCLIFFIYDRIPLDCSRKQTSCRCLILLSVHVGRPVLDIYAENRFRVFSIFSIKKSVNVFREKDFTGVFGQFGAVDEY